MSKITDKVSYLKGLAAGMKLNLEKDSNKLLMEVLGVMGEMAEEIQRMQEAHEELQDQVEFMDDDLSDLMEALYEEEDDADDEESDDCDCEDCEDDELNEEDDLIDYECPNCGAQLSFHANDVDFDEDALCPTCHQPIFPELDEDEVEE